MLLASKSQSPAAAHALSILPTYLSCFVVICQSVSLITNPAASSKIIGGGFSSGVIKLTLEQKESLAMAGMWFTPHVRQCKDFVTLFATNQVLQGTINTSVEEALGGNSLASLAPRLSFLTSFLVAAAPANLLEPGLRNIIEDAKHDESGVFGGSGGSFLSVFSVADYVLLLESLVTSHIFAKVVQVVGGGFFRYSTKGSDTSASALNDTMKTEASACAVLKAFLLALDHVSAAADRFVLSSDAAEVDLKERSDTLCSLVRELLVDTILQQARQRTAKLEQPQIVLIRQSGLFGPSRSSWLNQAMFEIVMFLDGMNATASSNDDNIMKSIIRPLAFSLLGSLNAGDEYFAVSLLSRSSIFQDLTEKSDDKTTSSNTAGSDDSSRLGSPMQRALLRELVGNADALHQLEHSSRLWNSGESSIGSSRTGSFGLTSLQRHAERRPRARIQSNDDNDDSGPIDAHSLLPLGPLWLWHALSSSVAVSKANGVMSAEAISETAGVLKSCLAFIVEMEIKGSLESNRSCVVASLLFTGSSSERGAKLYHISNIGMYPEAILRDEEIQRSVALLADNKDGNIDDAFVLEYIKACSKHSARSQHRSANVEGTPVKELDDGYALLQSLIGEDTTTSAGVSLSKHETQALKDFTGDLCQAFLEYGAQYSAFLLPVRALLHPSFPSTITVKVMESLHDMLRLLSTEDEMANDETLAKAVASLLRGGLPHNADQTSSSRRDPSEVIDAFAKTLKIPAGGNDMTRPPLHDLETGGVCYSLAVAIMARNLAANLRHEGSESAAGAGNLAMRKRFKNMPQETLQRVVVIAGQLLKNLEISSGKKELARVSVQACRSELALDARVFNSENDAGWKSLVDAVRS
jgi:hypothetical protein